METILQVSKRTITKLLKRANKKCSICGWDDATLDIHHIISRSNGGSDNMKNLISVCPNCHRSIHVNGDAFKTIKELKEISLDKTFSDWILYYNPKNTQKINVKSMTKCKNCGKDSPSYNTFCCHTCSTEYYVKNVYKKYDKSFLKNLLIENGNNIKKVSIILNISRTALYRHIKFWKLEYNKNKFNVSKEKLEKLIWEEKLPYTKIGEMFGVSDNAIRKRAKKLGIKLRKIKRKSK